MWGWGAGRDRAGRDRAGPCGTSSAPGATEHNETEGGDPRLREPVAWGAPENIGFTKEKFVFLLKVAVFLRKIGPFVYKRHFY